ncbi:MAG: DUF4105 domain-containing protein [Flavobacteriaceae bacterium]|nr:DUF4105 domain-containing protein [Flavobacteriaceae bacterium]
MKQHLFTFICIILLGYTPIIAQQTVTENASVSIITCGPGTELFTTFGHSAFRISDPSLGIDRIYNYGTFDFHAPYFLFNFAKGKLIYQLGTSDTGRFIRVYNYEKRWIKEQILNIDTEKVQAFYEFLENNAKPENKDYRYDFFYDNCATKLEEVITQILGAQVTFSNAHLSSNKTHRDLIDDYTQEHVWGKFGIDLALGSVIDKRASFDEYRFLPDYMMQAFEHATINRDGEKVPLIKTTSDLLYPFPKTPKGFEFTPLLLCSLIFLIVSLITFLDFKRKKRTKTLDFLLFFSTGIIGIIVLLLWFATDHTATYKNLNFLWAFAPNLILAFLFLKNTLKGWLKHYLLITLLLLDILLVVWIFEIQQFNTALIPLILALYVRYIYLFFNFKQALTDA